MTAHVLKGSKQEIAAKFARINGEVREAIVFVDEPATAAPDKAAADTGDIFAEMRPYMIDVPNIDDSRAAIYSRMEGE